MVGLARNLEGKYKEAEAVHEKELATSEKLLERRHSSTPVSVYYLAYEAATTSLSPCNDRACAGHSVVLEEESCRQDRFYSEAIRIVCYCTFGPSKLRVPTLPRKGRYLVWPSPNTFSWSESGFEYYTLASCTRSRLPDNECRAHMLLRVGIEVEILLSPPSHQGPMDM
jgi:hypothetical protein